MKPKKCKILAAVIFMFAVFSLTAFAADDVTVVIDCKPVEFDQPPVIENGRTLVPLRAIFEAMGAEVEWNGEKEEITAEKEKDIIKLTVNSTQAYVNGELRELDVPAQVVNDRTLVPVRFIAESMKCAVDWNGDTQTVIITDKPCFPAEEDNLYNPYGNTYGRYMGPTGKPGTNSAYFYTSMIEIPENKTLYFTVNRKPVKAAFICAYNENKEPVQVANNREISEFFGGGYKIYCRYLQCE